MGSARGVRGSDVNSNKLLGEDEKVNHKFLEEVRKGFVDVGEGAFWAEEQPVRRPWGAVKLGYGGTLHEGAGPAQSFSR